MKNERIEHANGLLASVAIQCVEPVSGKTGCFLFSGESHRDAGSCKTPVFSDLMQLFQWLPANGWNQIGHGLDARYIYHSFMPRPETV